jgi:hypothetical protein
MMIGWGGSMVGAVVGSGGSRRVREARSGMEWIDGGKKREDEVAGVTGGDRAGRAEHSKVKVQAGSESLRILELEMENLRLTRLVADLLLKNQQLRESN